VVTGQWVGADGEAVGWSVELSVTVFPNPNLTQAKLCNAILNLRKLTNRAQHYHSEVTLDEQ